MSRPTTRETVAGTVYYAMKRLRRGSDLSVHAAALEDGLKKYTRQNTYDQVQIELRKLAKMGVIKRTKTRKRKR